MRRWPEMLAPRTKHGDKVLPKRPVCAPRGSVVLNPNEFLDWSPWLRTEISNSASASTFVLRFMRAA